MSYIGANTWIWFSPLTDDALEEIAPKLAAWGFDFVELPVENTSDWDPRRAGELLAEHGLGATVCAVMAPGRELAGTDRETVAATQHYVRFCIDAAAAVSGEKPGEGVVGGPIYTSVGRTWLMGPDERRRLYAELAEALKPLADYAAERGVRLAVEPINRFETSVLNTTEQALEVVQIVDSAACGVLLDTFHMNIEERDMAAAIRSVGPRLFHLHACANDRGAPGNDHLDWPAMAAALVDIGYGGGLCIESFASDNRAIAAAAAIWRPLGRSQDEIATDGIAFLRQTLNEAE